MTNTTVMKVASGVTVMTMWEQMARMIYDTRWMFAFLALLILADFRYGWGECNKRFTEAEADGNHVLMDAYRWRTSRAIRRTLNKFVDYTVIVFIGLLFGQAFLPPYRRRLYMGSMGDGHVCMRVRGQLVFRPFLLLARHRGGDKVGDGISSGLRHIVCPPQGQRHRRCARRGFTRKRYSGRWPAPAVGTLKSPALHDTARGYPKIQNENSIFRYDKKKPMQI
jgi:hypothetical protein